MSAADASFSETDFASAYSWRIWRKNGEEGNDVHNHHWFNLMCLSVFELAAIEMIEVHLHGENIEYAMIARNERWSASITTSHNSCADCLLWAIPETYLRLASPSLTSFSKSTSASVQRTKTYRSRHYESLARTKTGNERLNVWPASTILDLV